MRAKHILYLAIPLAALYPACVCCVSHPCSIPAECHPHEIIRLEKILDSGDSSAISDHSEGLRLFLTMMGISHASGMTELTAAADSFRNTPGFSYFLPDVLAHFESTDTLERRIAHLKSNWSISAFPDSIYTVVSPYLQSIMTVDTTSAFIALNHYMGENYPPYESFPRHARTVKIEARIDYDLSEALAAAAYPYPEHESRLVSRMVYQGAVLFNTMNSVADSELATALGWSIDQLNWAEENERRIWQTIIENDWLYGDIHSVPVQLIDAAPSFPQISPDCPAGIARFLGYRIVQSYFKTHRSETLKQFFDSRKYLDPEILRLASYRP